jgi:large conductance mechanosensitive channel
MKKLLTEFKEFLTEYKVIGLAVAFMIGAAANQLVRSLVDNIVMPIITYAVPDGNWEEATLTIGSVVLSWGKFLADAIYFIVIALVVFFIAKAILKEDKVAKK